MNLTSAQKDTIGLTFVLDKIQADSPFGDKLMKAIKFYRKEEKADLNEEFDNITKVLECIKTDKDILSETRRCLMRFKDITNALKKLENSYLHEIELFEIKGFMLNLTRLQSAYSETGLNLFGVEFVDMEEALDILDPDKKRISPFYLSEQYTKELWDVRNEKSKLEELLRAQTDKAELEKLKVMRASIIAKEEAAETEVKKMLSEKLRKFLSIFFKNVESIGRLDFTMQKALLANEHNAVCPEVGEERVEFVEMINPEVQAVLEKTSREFTPISIELGTGTTLLTGANMGGKSVALKTAMLNVCLCHMGFFVFAKSARVPMFDGVCLISEDMQSISNGLSSFGAEIVRLNEIIKEVEKSHLFIALDEFARGTNPQEGALIARAIAKYLNTKSSVSIMTTHYDNIACEDFIQYQVAGLSGLDFDKLSARIAAGISDGVALIAEQMDYRLVKVSGSGKAPRDAINICRLLGVSDEVMEVVEGEYGR